MSMNSDTSSFSFNLSTVSYALTALIHLSIAPLASVSPIELSGLNDK